MAPVKIDPDKVRAFKDAESFYKWLGKNHDKEDEIWIKIHKVDSGLKSITPKQAIDVVLCWGWIDGIRKGFDDKSFLQRYTARTSKSIWSQINVDNVGRLIEIDLIEQDGGTLLRMTHSGLPGAAQRDSHAKGWTHYLGRLTKAAAGEDPGPDRGPAGTRDAA